MIDHLKMIFLMLNLLPLGIFWSLYARKSSSGRPFHLTWFRKELIISHFFSMAFILAWSIGPGIGLVVFNVLMIIFMVSWLKPCYSVLLSDLQYGLIVGGILLKKKGLMLSHGRIVPYERPRRSWGSGGSSSFGRSSGSSSSSSRSSSGGGSFGGGGSSGSW